MPSDWYEVVSGTEIEQGDIIRNCFIKKAVSINLSDQETEDIVEIERRDVIVISQTCDILQGKIAEILVANVDSYDSMVAQNGTADPSIKSSAFKKAAIQGNLIPYLLLNEEASENFPYSLVSFHHLHTIPKVVLEEFVRISGTRLRLNSPYKEHLAQGFAKYMMRVAQPTEPRGFQNYAAGGVPSPGSANSLASGNSN